MKKIGYILESFPVLSQTFVGNEIRAMRAQGHEVVILPLRRAEGDAQRADEVLAKEAQFLAEMPNHLAREVLVTPSLKHLHAISFVAWQKTLPRYSLLGQSMKIAALAEQHGCDHLHAHFATSATAHAIVAARWLGLTSSFVGHGSDINVAKEDVPLKLASADMAVAVCNDMVGDFRALYQDGHYTMVPCGTDPDYFKPSASDEHNGRLFYLGRLSASKGLDDLIKAMKLAGEQCAPVDIIGDGPLKNELCKLAKESGLANKKIFFKGPKHAHWLKKNVPNYIGMVAPFKPAEDGQRDTGPVVVKEAMAMGLPVVSTRLTGIKDTVTSETGTLVEPGDVEALARAMVSLSNISKDHRKTLGEAARARVIEHFSLAVSAEKLSRHIEALSNNKNEQNGQDYILARKAA